MSNTSFAKLVVWINALVPLAILCWDALNHRLGADPTKFALHTCGMLALIFLILSLAVTPLRLVSGKNYLSNFRRMLGLYAFFYACVHLCIYFVFDREMSFRSLLSETAKRPFILYGMTALTLMIPLAATSTTASVKRLGAARWKRLHQLAYISAVLGCVHYYYSLKADRRQPIILGIVLGVLLLYRVAVKYFPALKARRRAPAPA